MEEIAEESLRQAWLMRRRNCGSSICVRRFSSIPLCTAEFYGLVLYPYKHRFPVFPRGEQIWVPCTAGLESHCGCAFPPQASYCAVLSKSRRPYYLICYVH